MKDLRQHLTEICRERICLVGVGSPEHGDDGLGMRLADEIAEAAAAILAAPASPGQCCVLRAGLHPERQISRLTTGDFQHVVFLDAVEFGAKPGSVVLLNSSEMAARFPQVSTHKFSLGLVARIIEDSPPTRAWLLGVQPASLQPGANISVRVKKTLDALVRIFIRALQASTRPTANRA